MGGKQKPRTKGNVRPSNSARAAESLGRSGGAASGFVGFAGLSGDLGYVPALHVGEDDASVDADFMLTMRKMAKKDSTTKLKALQEFADLCKWGRKEEAEVKTVLPFWPRIYIKISIDHDRRVREASQLAMHELVLRVKRNLAPHLKQLMGAWLISQQDPYAPAASAARAAFQNAFSPGKHSEALVFCQNDIINYLEENLFSQSPQTLSDPKITDPADMQSKYERVMSCSLNAMQHLLKSIPQPQQEALTQRCHILLGEPKFWKLAKHKNVMIRAAQMSLLARICQTQPALACEYSEKLCPMALYQLNETDPHLCGPLWELVLHLISTIEDCWTKVNIRKGVLPNLWSLLRSPSGGSAAIVGPNLLPFLSKVPSSVLGEGIDFYVELFNNLKAGVHVLAERMDGAHANSVELTAFVKAYMECLKYVLIEHIDSDKRQHLIIEHVVENQLLTIVEASLADNSHALSVTPLYSALVDLLLSLKKLEITGGERAAELKRVSEKIWNGLQEFCQRYIDIADDSNPQSLERIGLLLMTFKNPTVGDRKKCAGVTFADEVQTLTSRKRLQALQSETHLLETEILLCDGGPVMSLVIKAVSDCFNRCRHLEAVNHLALLGHLLDTYINDRLISVLSSAVGSKEVDLTHNILFPWYKDYAKLPHGKHKSKAADVIADITFCIFKADCTKDKMTFLTQLHQGLNDVVLLHKIAQQAVIPPVEPEVRLWLKDTEFGERLVKLTRQLCEHSMQATEKQLTEEEVDGHWGLLSIALALDEHQEPLMDIAYVDLILSEIMKTLVLPNEGGDPNSVARCITFVCQVTDHLFNHMQSCFSMPACEQLVLALIETSCHPNIILSDFQRLSLKETWKRGLSAIETQRINMKPGQCERKNKIIFQATALIHKHVLDCAHEEVSNYTKRLDELASLSLEIARSSLSISDAADVIRRMYMRLCEKVPLEWQIWTAVENRLTLQHSPPDPDITIIPEILEWLSPVLYTSKLFVPEGSGSSELEIIDRQNVSIDHVLDLALATTFCLCTSDINSMGNMNDVSSAVLWTKLGMQHNLMNRLTSLVNNMSSQLLEKLLEEAITMSSRKGGLSSLTLDTVLMVVSHSMHPIDSDILRKYISSLNSFADLTEPLVHSLQVMMPYLPRTDLRQLYEIQTAQIMSSDGNFITKLSGCRGGLSIIAHGLELQSASSDAAVVQNDLSLAVLAELQCWREQHDSLFAFHIIVSELDWSIISLNIEVMSFVEKVVRSHPQLITEQQWDFILCSLTSWIQSCDESQSDMPTSVMTQAFATQVFRLLSTVSHCLSTVVSRGGDSFPANLVSEWQEFFCEGIYTRLLPMFVKAAENKEFFSSGLHIMLDALCAVTVTCPPDLVNGTHLSLCLQAEEEGFLTDDMQSLMNHICPLLGHRARSVQLTAYHLLSGVMPELPKFDEGKQKDEEKGEIHRSPPLALMQAERENGLALSALLVNLLEGQKVNASTATPDICRHSRAYLLTWRLIFTFFKAASSELRSQYALYLREAGGIDALMHSIFHLMPDSPLLPTSSVSCNDINVSMFSTEPDLKIIKENKRTCSSCLCSFGLTVPSSFLASIQGDGNCLTKLPRSQFCPKCFAEVDKQKLKNENVLQRFSQSNVCCTSSYKPQHYSIKTVDCSWYEVEHLACSVYLHALKDMPAILRLWWNSQDKRTTSMVEIFTSKYVSPVLCASEISSIKTDDLTVDNMTIKPRPAAREVVAIYTVDEVRMELVVCLSQNHPLGTITVESGKRIGIDNSQWRKWMLQLTTFLSHQNGSILDGLILWKRNVDKRFEGVEDCMICFSVIHGSNCQLPKLQCRTCKKRYHSACLYKWFNTSNNSTCPLCRNLF